MQVHLQQFGLGVAIQAHCGVVDRQKARRALQGMHPHRLRVQVKKHLVLLLRSVQRACQVAQLHHRTQGFGQNFQVCHAADCEHMGLVGHHLEQADHCRLPAQRHCQCRVHAVAAMAAGFAPAGRPGVVAQQFAAFAQRGPQGAVVQRHGGAQRAAHGPRAGLHHQLGAFQQLHHGAACAACATDAQRRIGHPGQHLGQPHVKRKDAPLQLQHFGMDLRVFHVVDTQGREVVTGLRCCTVHSQELWPGTVLLHIPAQFRRNAGGGFLVWHCAQRVRRHARRRQWLLAAQQQCSTADNPGGHSGDMGKGPCSERPAMQTPPLRRQSV